jgi:hypothetical protein
MSLTRLILIIGGAPLLTPLIAAVAPPFHSNQGARAAPPLIRSARSGPWSAPATWERGQVPGEGARVQIRAGDRVTYDQNAATPIRSIHVAGTLAFARDQDTRLDVGLIKIQPGEDASENGFDCDASTHFVGTRPPADPTRPQPTLEVGTSQQPINSHHLAHIRLVYFPGMDRQSCPAIVCCGGRMELHGAPMSRTWVKLSVTAAAGATVITLAEPVTGWRIGDHLIITATQRIGSGSHSGTFRPNHAPLRPADGQASPPANDPTQAALAAAEARLMAEIVPKFVFIRPGEKGRPGTEIDRDPSAEALSGARVALWAAEMVQQRHAPGKEAAVAVVFAARAALGAAEQTQRPDSPNREALEAACATARSALSVAETALRRNASDRDATQAGIAAVRASIAAGETAKIPADAAHEAAMRAGLLEIAGGEHHRRVLPAFTEERAIQAIDGARVTLDRPLVYDHRAAGDYRGEVANLSRNLIVESAEPAGVRGHTMYHRGSAGSISYAEFRHLGKEGVLGRYSLHFHLVGNTMRGSSVTGASIWDSANRWLTIHGTNYLVVRDCVGYQSAGHGFYVEDGSEVYNVFDRNLAVQAFSGRPLPKQNLPFDLNEGAGFWWANSLNTFTRNVACECDGYGYRFEATPTEGLDLHMPVQQPDGRLQAVDIRTLPFVRFADNEAHSILYGLNLGEGMDNVGPDLRHPFVLRNTRLWNAQWAFRPDAPSMIVENMDIYGSRYGIFQPIYDHHAYHGLTINQTEVPGGHPFITIGQVPDGLEFKDAQDRGRLPSGAAVEKRLGPGDYLRGRAITKALTTSPPGEAKARFVKQSADPLATPPPEPPSAPLSSTAFPRPLDPVDDLPPATVITFTGRTTDGRLVVRGTTSDNGTVRRVLVNGQEARPLAPNFSEWEIALEGAGSHQLQLSAYAEDSAGNVEKLPHVVSLAGAE